MPNFVPPPTLGPKGFVSPSASDILTGVCATFVAAMPGLVLDPTIPSSMSSPEGQWATSTAAIIADKDDVFCYFVSQVDPQYAQGRMQDAIARIYFLERFPATPTIVPVVVTGVVGTVISAGFLQGRDSAGNIYATTATATIGGGGTVTVSMENLATGPIPCPAGTLTSIYTGVTGVDAITNPTGTDTNPEFEGRAAETAQEFEFRRRNSVALNAKGSPESIYAAVFQSGAGLVPPNIPSDVLVRENRTNAPLAIGAVTLVPHSVYVAVVGGDDASIAAAIHQKKDLGCDMNGNTTVTVEDTNYTPPVPYDIVFERPSALPIFFQVNIAANPLLPAGLTGLIQTAIVAASLGQDGGAPMRIGAKVFASRFVSAVQAIDPSVQVVSLFVGTAPGPSGATVAVEINQHGTTNAAEIAVAVV